MIAYITGRMAAKGAGFAIVEAQGMGYRLLMSTRSIAALPAEGDEVTVHTYLHVREDELTLFGFESEDERGAFEALLGVAGVGPKVALATLSSITPDLLASAVASGDATLLASVPGVGKKTAGRMILELADKLVPGQASGVVPGAGVGAGTSEARDALLSMGFTSAEVVAALAGAPEGDAEAALRHALVRLGGGS